MKKAKIFSLIFMPQVQQYVVILEELEGTRLLPIWIGVNEGNSIALHMEQQQVPRPLSHDLFVNILKTLQVKVEKVVISDLKDNIYYATIHIKSNSKQFPIDARPSDSMCIAVRTNAPIYIEDKVLEKCPIIQKPISDKEAEEFKTRLRNLKPEDFFKEQM